jgi:uncharacterized protein YbaR (Trm112 family)
VPDSIRDVQFDAAKEIFVCMSCRKNYRIIPDEFAFYKSLEIPLPKFCPDCRHARRMRARGPNKLFSRRCMCGGKLSIISKYQNTVSHFHGAEKCPNEFQTAHDSNTQMLYCEQCYNAEVV